MKYKRKTEDEFQIWTNYGYGWEIETTETTWRDAKQTHKDYLANASGLLNIKIKKVRIKITEVTK